MSASASKNFTGPANWVDPKRWLWLLSPIVPVLGLTGAWLGYSCESALLFWSMPLFVYGLVPVLDWLIGRDHANPPEEAVAELERSLYYRIIVYAYIPTQYITTVVGAWIVAQGQLGFVEIAGLVLTVGSVNGIGINTAHELGHRAATYERWLSKLALAPVMYGHFYVEHNRGHHKNVATAHDPASARLGESFYAYLPRTMIGSLKSAWQLEKTSLQRRKLPVWSLHNDNLQAWMMSALLFTGLGLWLGSAAVLFLLVQGFFGAVLLEVINYIEHYGLLRQFNEKTGRYQRCTPAHSWNSNNIVTNLLLYQLQRHSDHHANPMRRFQSLRHFDDSPQLPSGYASMVVLAFVPTLWFYLMDKRVVAHYGGDVSLAHVHEPKRQALVKRWGS